MIDLVRASVRSAKQANVIGVVAIIVTALTIVACGSSSANSQSSGQTSSSSAAATSAAATTSSAAATSSSSAQDPGLMTPGTFSIGLNPQFKPEDYVVNGKPVGYEVDLAQQLAASMGAKLQMHSLDFTGLIPGLQANQFDMVAQSLSYTPERAKVVSFSRPYIPYAVILGVPAGKAAGITSAADLNKPGKTITALQGSLAENIAHKDFPKATINALPDQNAAMLQVATGRADGVVVEGTNLAQFNVAYPGKLAIAHIAKPFELEYGRYAFHMGNTKLINYVNSWICKSESNGALAAAYTKYFKTPWPGLPSCS